MLLSVPMNLQQVNHQITLSFDSLGMVTTAGTESVASPVDCGVTPDPATAAVLSTFAVTVNQMLGHEVAFLNASLSGTALTPGNCTTLLGAGAGNAVAGDSGGGEIRSACGCRVAECGFGVLVAEALRFGAEADVAFVNAGSIRGGLVAGRAVKLGNILEAVPFLNEVVSLWHASYCIISRFLYTLCAHFSPPPSGFTNMTKCGHIPCYKANQNVSLTSSSFVCSLLHLLLPSAPSLVRSFSSPSSAICPLLHTTRSTRKR